MSSVISSAFFVPWWLNEDANISTFKGLISGLRHHLTHRFTVDVKDGSFAVDVDLAKVWLWAFEYIVDQTHQAIWGHVVLSSEVYLTPSQLTFEWDPFAPLFSWTSVFATILAFGLSDRWLIDVFDIAVM